mgnify:CR=1 FL=1
MAVDGSLKFDTKIDTDGVEKGARNVKDVMKDVVDTVENTGNSVSDAFDGGSAKINGFIKKIQDAERELQDLTTEMNKLATEQIPTDEFTNLQKEIQSTENQLLRYYNRREKLETLGISEESKAWKSLQYDISTTEKKLQLLEEGMDTIKANGLDFTLGKQSAEFEKMEMKAEKLRQKITEYNQKLMESKTVHLQNANSTGTAEKSVNKFGKTAEKTAKSTNKLSNSMSNNNKRASGLSKTFKMLGMSIAFSMVFRAIQTINKAITEGMQNLAQYSPTLNKSMSALATSLLTLKNSFATAFSPILTFITPTLQTLINTIAQAITYMGQFFAVMLTGATTFTKAKDAQVDYAKSLANTAKESNKALSPIDKLNSVSESGGGGSSSGPLPKDMFEEVKINPKILKFIDDMKKKLEPVIKAVERLQIAFEPFSKNVGQGLKWFLSNVLIPLGNWTISKAIPSFLDLLGASITVLNSILETFKPLGLWLWDNFLKPLAVWTGGSVVTGIDTLTDALYRLSDWINANQSTILKGAVAIGSFFVAFKIVELVTWLGPLVSGFISAIASGQTLSAVLTGLSTLFSAISTPVTVAVAVLGALIYSFIDLYSSSEKFRKSVAQLGETWWKAIEPLATFVKTVLTDAWKKILQPVIEYFLTDLLPKLNTTFKNLWQKVLVPIGKFIGTVLTPIFRMMADLLTSLWKNIVLPLAQAFGKTLKEALTGLYEVFNKTILPIVGKVIEVLTWLWKNVINPIIDVLWDSLKPAFDTVFKAIGDVIQGFLGILQGFIQFITGVFTGNWSKAWGGVRTIFKNIFDSLVAIAKTPINLIIDIINGMINGITSGINAVIRGINAISFTMPDWLGGGTVGFNIRTLTTPKIPKLANGAVIPPNNEFLAILGDQKKGTNIEAPLSTIEEAVANVISRMGGGTGGDITLVVNLDGKQIHSSVVKQDQLYKNRTGASAFA